MIQKIQVNYKKLFQGDASQPFLKGRFLMNKPAHIQKAIFSANTTFLSNAGKNGARKANKIRIAKRAQKEALAEARQERCKAEEHARKMEANEYIVPIDPSDPETPES